MSSLKEEWASLMKLRESGFTDLTKKQEIKSRIFNNFYSVKQQNYREIEKEIDVQVKNDYEQLRTQFLKSIEINNRAVTPEIPKKYDFGLKNVVFPPSANKANRPGLKSDDILGTLSLNKTEESKKENDFWTIKDSVKLSQSAELVEDRFEIHSIASNEIGIAKKSYKISQIDIFADLSPIARHMVMLSNEDEERYLKESCSRKDHIFGYFHIVHEDINRDEFDRLEWNNIRKVVLGLTFRTEVLDLVVPPSLEKSAADSDANKNSISQCLSEPPILIDTSIVKATNLKTSSSTVPMLPVSSDISLLEKEMISMMDSIKYSHSINNPEKLQALLDKSRDKLRNPIEVKHNPQFKAIFQVLSDLQKAGQSHSKSPISKKTIQPKPNQKKSTTPIRGNRMNKIDSQSSMSSAKSSKWIGGSKHIADFEDDNWVTPNLEKKKKETRHEMLYKLSMKK